MQLQLCCLHFLETNCQIANTVAPSLIQRSILIMSTESSISTTAYCILREGSLDRCRYTCQKNCTCALVNIIFFPS